jgi:glycosyltransferase involved in cell wall biosynthesis
VQNARVGIVLATYNGDRAHLIAQIASIQTQDWQNWQCLITDDGSTAEIQAVIRQQIAADPRFVYYAQPRNLGAYHNFEYGLNYFRQDEQITHIAFSDQDDIWRSDKLTRLVAVLESSQAELVHSDLALIDDAGQLLQPSVWQYEHRHPEKLTVERLLLRNTVTGCTMMIRRSLLTDALPFPPQAIAHGWYHDHWLALVAAYRGGIVHLREPLVRYRQHGRNVVGTQPAAGTLRQELRTWLAKKGQLGLRSYRIHRDLSRAFYQRFYPEAAIADSNPFSDRRLNFGLPILWLGLRSALAGYGVQGVTLRLFVNKVIFDVQKLKAQVSTSLFGVGVE